MPALTQEKLRDMRQHLSELSLILDDLDVEGAIGSETRRRFRNNLSPLVGWMRDLSRITGHSLGERE